MVRYKRYPNIEFDPMFLDKIYSGQKTVTFRQGPAKAIEGDIFPVLDKSEPRSAKLLKIYRITEMNLYYFVSHYWHSDGFNTPDECVDWMKKHYFEGDIGENYGAKFSALTGHMYVFSEVGVDQLKRRLVNSVDSFNLSIDRIIGCLDLLNLLNPGKVGYDTKYLETCDYFLKTVNKDSPMYFSFEERMFPEGDSE